MLLPAEQVRSSLLPRQPCAMASTPPEPAAGPTHDTRNRIAGRYARPRLVVHGSSDALPLASRRAAMACRRESTCSGSGSAGAVAAGGSQLRRASCRLLGSARGIGLLVCRMGLSAQQVRHLLPGDLSCVFQDAEKLLGGEHGRRRPVQHLGRHSRVAYLYIDRRCCRLLCLRLGLLGIASFIGVGVGR